MHAIVEKYNKLIQYSSVILEKFENRKSNKPSEKKDKKESIVSKIARRVSQKEEDMVCMSKNRLKPHLKHSTIKS